MTIHQINKLQQGTHLKTREVFKSLKGQPNSDGAGVSLTRLIGTNELDNLDPFLLLDFFESDQPQDYLAGFPDHPHRGFETVTYLLNGRVRHKDSAGHEGVVEPGGVQWMTAGKGIVHSEMPEQENGLLRGFQLWVNLPAHSKMTDPAYQEFPANKTEVEMRPGGTQIRVIAGRTNQGIQGPVKNHYVNPTYMDIQLTSEDNFVQQLPADQNTFIYLIEGKLEVGDNKMEVNQGTITILTEGDQVSVRAIGNSRFLLISGDKIKEPIARYGPFVMNTQAEVMQAFQDYQNNQF